MTVTTRNPTRESVHGPLFNVQVAPIDPEGLLSLPGAAEGIILFAHASGSGCLSPCNTNVAGAPRAGRQQDQ
jgi:hypothetical protein